MTENNDSVNTDGVSGNSQKAVNFLKYFRSNGIHNIVAIDPVSEAVTGITRRADSPDIVAFIEKYNGVRNLYYSVNTPYDNAPDGKLSKHHIAKIHAVWLDADPHQGVPFTEERDRLLKFATQLKTSPNPPTYITDSGGGIQAFWMFDKPLDATKDNVIKAESLSRGLAEQYDTDYVQNIDRIMRIPFTVNIPSQRKKGRARTVASVLHATPQKRTYADMPFITPSFKAESETEFEHTEVDMAAIKAPLPDALIEKLKNTLNRDQKAHDIYYGLIEKPSRSEYDFTLAQQLAWDGYSLQEVAHILYHFPHGKNKDLTKREIVRTYNRVDKMFNDLPPEYVAQIESQTNPILAARAAGKPLPEDLNKNHKYRSVNLHDMDWRHSGAPIYKSFLYEKAITVIYGQSNVGKSFIAADIAGHVALGRNWGNYKFKPKKPIHVLYIAAEAGASFGKRGKALRKRLGVDKLPFKVITNPLKFVKDRDDAKGIVGEIERLKREEDIEIGLVVVDTLATTFEGGNENSSEDMGMYISNMKWIQHYGNCGVMIVHHSGKDQAAGARGHSSLRAATDTEIEILSEKKGERYRRIIRVRKQREAESDFIIKFGLMIVELGRDDEGDVIDTCHVVLENDSEFESTVPPVVYSAGEQAVLDADRLYATIKDPEAIKAKCKMTEMQIKVLLHRDLKERLGVLVANDGTLNTKELAFMQKPTRNDSLLKNYQRDLQSVSEKGDVSEFDV